MLQDHYHKNHLGSGDYEKSLAPNARRRSLRPGGLNRLEQLHSSDKPDSQHQGFSSAALRPAMRPKTRASALLQAP